MLIILVRMMNTGKPQWRVLWGSFFLTLLAGSINTSAQAPAVAVLTAAPVQAVSKSSVAPASPVSAEAKSPLSPADASPLSLVKLVANRFMADTHFDLVWEPQTEVLGMQVIDMRSVVYKPGMHALAYCAASAVADTAVPFAISSPAAVKVWVNGKLVYTQSPDAVRSVASLKIAPAEYAYNRFRFTHFFAATLKKGLNAFLIEVSLVKDTPPVVFLRAQDSHDDLIGVVSFKGSDGYSSWLLSDTLGAWQYAPRRMMPELVIDSHAAYQRESYANWHYSHGTTVWCIQQLGLAAKDAAYTDFVKKYTGFVLDHVDLFGRQYDSLFAFRGTMHRLFRRSMLDDAGAPTLPFAALYTADNNTALKRLVDSMAHFVSHQQVRLPDGTFCRPEPLVYTVWADDLFMSVPFLCRMALETGNKSLLDDAVRQVLQFQHYLLEPATGLYKHGWFSSTQQRSVAYWGRANGWVAWATAELLNVLPASHPDHKKVLAGFRSLMRALVAYQSSNGMWHQLLNRPDSYEETSCTAIFTLAIARGVRKGWLPKAFKTYAVKGWNAVALHIGKDGVVTGICRGTEIGDSEQFYRDRKTIDNDPRGLGAVMMAGIEMTALN